MYETYFGLKEKPFRITPDPRFLYLSEKHGEALDHLIYGIRQGEGFMVITGDVGTGKTTVIRSLLERLEASPIKTALILNPLMDWEELLKAILEDFGLIPRGSSRKEWMDQLNAFLLSLNREGKKAVVIIDESQNLTPALLEELRSLSNLETDQEKLLQVVLVGQLELWDKLNRFDLKQLRQRISVQYRLTPLSFTEMKGYIAHRLKVAGMGEASIFSLKALRRIYRYSQGIPRLVNLLCDRTLLVLYAEQKREATPVQVEKALESLPEIQRTWRFWKGWGLRPSVMAPIGLSLVLFLGGAVYLKSPSLFSGTRAFGKAEESSLTRETFSRTLYTVHVASFRRPQNAEGLIRRLCQEGLEAFGIVYEHPETGKWYRVVAGQFEGVEEAKALAQRLRSDGSYPLSVVITLPKNPTPIKGEKKGARS